MSAYTEEYVQGLLAENERLRVLVDGLKAESEAQVANLASLYVAVTSVHGALDRPSVLSSVQEIVTNLIGSEEMAIFETDAARGRLRLLASMGIEPGPYRDIALGEGAIGRAASTGERLIRQEGGALTGDGDAALTACIPLKVAGRIVGVLAVPALVFFVGFAVIPLIAVLALSFTTWDGIGDIHLSGLTSWGAVLTDPGLPHALWVTFLITALSWAVQTPISILLGVFLAGAQRYRAVLSVMYFIPLLLSSAAIAITYKALLDPNFGLGAGLHLPFLAQDWLGKPQLAFSIVIFVVSWQFIPFHSLIYQGGVRQIPRSMYEAAELDGAGRIRKFFSITIPQLKYTIITSSTLMVVGSLTFFDLIFVLTEGGPGDATRVLALDMYKRGFQANLMGPASAIAVILVLLGLALALLLRRVGGGDPADSQMEGA